MKNYFAAVLMLFAGVMTVSAAALPKGKVNADKLNLRLGPGVVHPVVGSVPQNTEVTIVRVLDSWLEIEAPESMTAFVSEARVGADGILIGELNMRSKMSSKAPCLGTLPKGTKVEKLEKRANGWVEIRIPASAKVKVYAAGFFVNYNSAEFDAKGNPLAAAGEVKTPETAAPAEAKPAETEKTAAPAEAKPAEAEKTAAPAENKPAEAKPAAEKVELQGVLVRWKYSEAPETRYALLTEKDGFNQAFLTGDEAQLAGAENLKVKISGTGAGRFGSNGAIIVKVDKITVF